MSAQNWPRDHVRPESYISKVHPEISDRHKKAAVDIQGIADRQEGIKTDAQRQDDVAGVDRPISSEHRADCADIIEQKMRVFEIRQQAEICTQAAQQPNAPAPGRLLVKNAQ